MKMRVFVAFIVLVVCAVIVYTQLSGRERLAEPSPAPPIPPPDSPLPVQVDLRVGEATRIVARGQVIRLGVSLANPEAELRAGREEDFVVAWVERGSKRHSLRFSSLDSPTFIGPLAVRLLAVKEQPDTTHPGRLECLATLEVDMRSSSEGRNESVEETDSDSTGP